MYIYLCNVQGSARRQYVQENLNTSAKKSAKSPLIPPLRVQNTPFVTGIGYLIEIVIYWKNLNTSIHLYVHTYIDLSTLLDKMIGNIYPSLQ